MKERSFLRVKLYYFCIWAWNCTVTMVLVPAPRNCVYKRPRDRPRAVHLALVTLETSGHQYIAKIGWIGLMVLVRQQVPQRFGDCFKLAKKRRSSGRVFARHMHAELQLLIRIRTDTEYDLLSAL